MELDLGGGPAGREFNAGWCCCSLCCQPAAAAAALCARLAAAAAAGPDEPADEDPPPEEDEDPGTPGQIRTRTRSRREPSTLVVQVKDRKMKTP